MRLRNRLLLVFAAVIGLGSLTVLLTVRGSAEALLRSFVMEGDLEKAALYAQAAAERHREAGGWAGAQEYFLARLPPGESERLTIADASGLVVVDTGESFLGSVHPPRHLAKGLPVVADGTTIGVIMVGSMVDSSLGDRGDRFLASITAALLGGVAAATAAALVLGAFLSLGLSRPLDSLAAAIERVSGGDLDSRLPVRGGEELARVARSFNAMTARLAELEAEKKRIIADSAHELRTPVALIRGTVEAMIDGVYPVDRASLDSLLEETLRLSRLVDSLRELELIDSGRLALAREEVDLADLARATALAFRAAAREAGVAIEVEVAPEGAPRVLGDAMRLGEALRALVDNALKYGGAGGRILVAVSTGEAGAAVLAVEDAGPGIPPGERDRVFERFYRLEKSRSTDRGGRGLGLSLAREIVRASGGELACGASERLGGARFAVTLPAAPSGPTTPSGRT